MVTMPRGAVCSGVPVQGISDIAADLESSNTFGEQAAVEICDHLFTVDAREEAIGSIARRIAWEGRWDLLGAPENASRTVEQSSEEGALRETRVFYLGVRAMWRGDDVESAEAFPDLVRDRIESRVKFALDGERFGAVNLCDVRAFNPRPLASGLFRHEQTEWLGNVSRLARDMYNQGASRAGFYLYVEAPGSFAEIAARVCLDVEQPEHGDVCHLVVVDQDDARASYEFAKSALSELAVRFGFTLLEGVAEGNGLH
jgi:hypothetical protein